MKNLKTKVLGAAATVGALASHVSASYSGDYTFSDIPALTGDFVGNLLVGMVGEADTLGEVAIILGVIVLVIILLMAVVALPGRVIGAIGKMKKL